MKPARPAAERRGSCIEDPQVIEKIPAHPDAKASEPEAPRRPLCRAPPQRGLFDATGWPQDDVVWAVASAARHRRRLYGKPAGGEKCQALGIARVPFSARLRQRFDEQAVVLTAAVEDCLVPLLSNLSHRVAF